MRVSGLAVALLVALSLTPLHAQQAQPTPSASAPQSVPNDGIRTEATVVVEGEQPGPGMWIVRKDNHDLYILGTLSPLPAKMQWQSAQVDRVLAQAQEVIRAPYAGFKVDVGWFKGMLLLPKLLGARNNPDDKKLQEVVSPASYARWQVLKSRYIGSDSSVEKWRPIFAAQELYGKA
ncbi:MAG TPA: TraB/GumN family protein, partial [Thermomonas sp.]|nr:TraB/GumN family protein [Thermomonas sp.]